MNKWSGKIGFADGHHETKPGYREERIVEKSFFGDITKMTVRESESNSILPNATVRNSVSVLLNPYIHDNIMNIRYFTWLGKRWIPQSIDIEWPRVILRPGEVYNGPEPI